MDAEFPGIITARGLTPNTVRAVPVDVAMGAQTIHYRHRGALADGGHTASLKALDHGLLLARAVVEAVHVDLNEFLGVQHGEQHFLHILHNQTGAVQDLGSCKNAFKATLKTFGVLKISSSSSFQSGLGSNLQVLCAPR